MAASMSNVRNLADKTLDGGSGKPWKQSFTIVLNNVRFCNNKTTIETDYSTGINTGWTHKMCGRLGQSLQTE
jgi:hypothetical protein